MQNAECRRRVTPFRIIRFDGDKAISFCPPDLKINLSVYFYYLHSYCFIKLILRKYNLKIINTVSCDHNSAF